VKLEEGDLVSEVEGEIGLDEKVLVIRRVRVTYHLEIEEEHREVAERVHDFHARFCPVARTIDGCVQVETTLRIG
jgi:organic hydroperoxide reductase OsmC/OhrA